MNIRCLLPAPDGVVGNEGNPSKGKGMDRLSSAPESSRYFPLLWDIALHLKFYQSEFTIISRSFIFIGFLLGFLSLHSSQIHNTPLYPAYASGIRVRVESFALKKTHAALISICAIKYFISLQIGPNARELFRLVEDFIDVIGFRMKDFRDSYQVTDNLGELICTPHVG